MTVVNESGLYSLLFTMQPQKKSHMTEEKFQHRVETLKNLKRWITHEVIPTIRKTGGYVANDDLFIQTYLPFADDQTKLFDEVIYRIHLLHSYSFSHLASILSFDLKSFAICPR
ncbi:hypothetical protein PVN24_21080 [Bacillus paralicheniformis]|nr:MULTISPECIES: hypothetical protein [Bacillus]MDE1385312.1 hypothetical protein [Bacillus paralicheniformis]